MAFPDVTTQERAPAASAVEPSQYSDRLRQCLENRDIVRAGVICEREDFLPVNDILMVISSCLKNLRECGRELIDTLERRVNTPILHHLAKSEKSFPKLIQYFIYSGSDPNKRNELGETPLHIAARHRKGEIVQALLDYTGADIHAKDGYGAIPMHRAAYANAPDIITLLHQHGSSLDLTDARKSTPLHYAQAAEGKEAVAKLLALGARRRQKNDYGQKFDQCKGHIVGPKAATISHTNSIGNWEMQIYEGWWWGAHLLHEQIITSLRSTNTVLANAFLTPVCEDETIRSIQSGGLVILPVLTDSKTHAICLVFCSGFFGICNTADLADFKEPNICLYPIDPTRVTKQDLQTIYHGLDIMPGDKAYDELYTVLPSRWKINDEAKSRQAKEFEKALSPGIQKVGNCLFASAKTALLLAHALLNLDNPNACEEAKKFKKRWSLEFRLSTLDIYLVYEYILKPDPYLIEQAWKKIAKHLKKLYPNPVEAQRLLGRYQFLLRWLDDKKKTINSHAFSAGARSAPQAADGSQRDGAAPS